MPLVTSKRQLAIPGLPKKILSSIEFIGPVSPAEKMSATRRLHSFWLFGASAEEMDAMKTREARKMLTELLQYSIYRSWFQ